MVEAPDLSHIVEDLRPLAVEIESVRPDPENTMGHPEGNIAAIARSLERYGQRKPIVVNRDGRVIEAGNGAWQAAQSLGWSHIAAVFVEDDASEAIGYSIADNRTAQLAQWDAKMLMAAFDAVPRALDIPGVDEGFLREIAEEARAGDGEPEVPPARVDKAEELREKWGVESGQLWGMGKYAVCPKCGRIHRFD